MDKENRNFYHSFPRPRPNESREHNIEVGLEILRQIQHSGLLLAPEVVEWNQPTVSGEDRKVIIRQHRICFTELARIEVKEHGKKFGPFSLEFGLDTLRRLGALPVIYMPQNIKDDRELSSVGALVVATLGDVKHTLDQLQTIWELCDRDRAMTLAPGATSMADDYKFNLHNIDPAGNVTASYEVSNIPARDMLSFIGYRNAPYELMAGVLRYVLSLFYPTDDTRHDKQLDYYRQREWRLVEGLASNGKTQCRLLRDDEKAALLDGLNGGFWSKELSDGKNTFRQVDDTYVIEEFNGKPIVEAISAVIVPTEAYEEAKNLFGDKATSYYDPGTKA